MHIYESLICFAGCLLLLVVNKSIDSFLIDLLKENDLHELVHEDSNELCVRRLKKAKPVLLLITLWPQFDYSVFWLGGVLALFLLMYKKDYLTLKKNQKQKVNQLKFQFPIWLRQLQILIQTNTVVTSLILSCNTAPALIQEDLSILIHEIEEDAIHLTPYMNFLKAYRLSEIERAMKLLYRYNTVGKEDAYVQFNRMIQTTTKWLRSERSSRAESKLMFFQWWGMLPLLGVTVLFMAIMFEIIINLFGEGVKL